MASPVVFINFKTYREATGSEAVKLAEQCEKARKDLKADIRIAIQTADIYRVTQSVRIPVYAQHNDPTEPGQNTGWDTPLAIRSAGARGAFLNHSEHRMRTEDIIVASKLLQEEGMETVVFCESVDKLRQLDKHIRPTWYCIEPPELVGGGVSVSHAKPELVKNAVHATDIPVLVGAGVKTHEDIQIALDLGAEGVVLASGIVLANHRMRAFKKLLIAHAA